jgi:hypothetical protein
MVKSLLFEIINAVAPIQPSLAGHAIGSFVIAGAILATRCDRWR